MLASHKPAVTESNTSGSARSVDKRQPCAPKMFHLASLSLQLIDRVASPTWQTCLSYEVYDFMVVWQPLLGRWFRRRRFLYVYVQEMWMKVDMSYSRIAIHTNFPVCPLLSPSLSLTQLLWCERMSSNCWVLSEGYNVSFLGPRRSLSFFSYCTCQFEWYVNQQVI